MFDLGTERILFCAYNITQVFFCPCISKSFSCLLIALLLCNCIFTYALTLKSSTSAFWTCIKIIYSLN